MELNQYWQNVFYLQQLQNYSMQVEMYNAYLQRKKMKIYRANRVKITRLPQKLLFSVLYKLPNNDLCRMRRTCSLINNSVEKWRKRLSVRYALGLDLEIGTLYNTTEKLFRLRHGRGPCILISAPNVEQFLSAISINQIYINIAANSDDVINFVKMLSDRPLEAIDIQPSPLEHVVELANTVNCREQIRIKIDSDDIGDVQRTLNILQKTRNPWKLHIIGLDFDSVGANDVYDQVKHFGWIYLNHIRDINTYYSLLWEIYRSASHHNNCRIFCMWDPNVKVNNPLNPTPPMEILWEINEIPPEHTHLGTPLLIRKMSLGQKCAIICMEQYNHRHKERANESIYIIDDVNIEIFKTIEECLFIGDINEDLRRLYLNTSKTTTRKAILYGIYALAEKYSSLYPIDDS